MLENDKLQLSPKNFCEQETRKYTKNKYFAK